MYAEDVVLAAPMIGGKSTDITVMACSSSRLLATKTGEQDLSLALDLERHRPLAKLLCRWAGLRSRNSRLWDLTYPQLRLVFKQAAVAVGAQKLGASLHSLRHGGASHDRLSNARSLLDVQLRGAWRSTSSLQRYEKFGLVAKELGKLEANTLQAANQATEMLLLNSERVFEPLFGRRRASTGSSWSSSLAKEGSAPPCAAMAELVSRPTSATARTLTSPTLK